MPLPIQPLPLIERWDCHQCGACCRGSIVPLSDDDVARLQAQNWHQRPEFRDAPVMIRESWLGHEYRLARADGSCVFLAADGLCTIHKLFGFDAKPLVCRMFPLQIVPRDNVAYLTIRRACPSAAADQGRPVAEQLEFARKLARERKLALAPPIPPPIKPGELRESRRVARQMLQSCQRLLTDERYPLVRRLVHSLILVRLLERAKTRSLTDDRLMDLLGVLEQNVADEVGDVFAKRERPSGAAAVLFRQTAAEFVRLHPGFIVTPGWPERWRLAVAAWRMVRGRGQLPRLHPSFPDATFEQLEEPLGVLEPAFYQPLCRMIETTSVAWTYALANRSGWSIVESLRMLALTYPIALWLLRWRAAGAAPKPEFIPEIITALDRGQGYAPLAGRKQKQRVQVLAKLDELERLVVWYAR